MKSVLVIGIGRFGRFLSTKLTELGNEVMVVDTNEESINELLPYVSNAEIGDCTNAQVLESIGVKNFDIVFVCIGEDFQSSLEITSLVKEMGAPLVVAKANRNIHAKFLLRNGADRVVYPERDMAEKVAIRYSADNVFDLIELSEDYFICEIATPEEWYGSSIAQINCRAKYGINILVVKVGDKVYPMPDADHVFNETEHLMIMGSKKAVKKLLDRI